MVENSIVEERYIVNLGTQTQDNDIDMLINELNERSVFMVRMQV